MDENELLTLTCNPFIQLLLASLDWPLALSRRGVRHSHREVPLPVDEDRLMERITTDPGIFGGKPIIRGHRLAIEHVLSMLAAGDSIDTILEGYPWLQKKDILACLVYAKRLVARESSKTEPATSKR